MSKLPNTGSKYSRTGSASHWINALAAFLILLATTSLVFISYLASRQADRQAHTYEVSLFEHAEREIDLRTAQNMAALVYSDETVENVAHMFDGNFVRHALLNHLWEDFLIERSYLISPEGKVVAKAFRDYVTFSSERLPPGSNIHKLAERNQATYAGLRIPHRDGFTIPHIPYNTIGDLADISVGFIDRKPAHLVAMPIVPHEGEVALDDKPPFVLITIRFIDAQYVSLLKEKLPFSGLQFTKGSPPETTDFKSVLYDMDGQPWGYYSWTGQSPGQGIWNYVIPILLVLISAISGVGLFAARKTRVLVNALEDSERLHRFNALHDPLTGIANRFQFTQKIDELLEQDGELEFALIVCDLDRFKDINDTYGHLAGDTAICEVAARLTRTTGDMGLVARSGGDEFVILIENAVDRAAITSLCERILREIGLPIAIPPHPPAQVGISLGVAFAADHGKCEAQLLAAADKALYKAKEKGRGAYEYADLPDSIYAA